MLEILNQVIVEYCTLGIRQKYPLNRQESEKINEVLLNYTVFLTFPMEQCRNNIDPMAEIQLGLQLNHVKKLDNGLVSIDGYKPSLHQKAAIPLIFLESLYLYTNCIDEIEKNRFLQYMLIYPYWGKMLERGYLNTERANKVFKENAGGKLESKKIRTVQERYYAQFDYSTGKEEIVAKAYTDSWTEKIIAWMCDEQKRREAYGAEKML